MSDRTIFITGGAGFIGSRLVDRIIKESPYCKVIIFDNLHPQVHGPNPTFSESNENIKFINGDVEIKEALQESIIKYRPSVIFHLAAETGTGQSHDEPVRYCGVNVMGTANLLEAVRNTPTVEQVVLAGSRAVYGEGAYLDAKGNIYPGMHRTTTDMEAGNYNVKVSDQACEPIKPWKSSSKLPAFPSSIYASTKLMQEHLLVQASEGANWRSVILRFQNVYGAGQSLNNPYTGVLSIFSRMILEGKSLGIYEDGNISRDFVYVDDVVTALHKAIGVNCQNGEIIDIGFGKAVSIYDVANKLTEYLGGDSVKNKITGEFRAGDIRHACADISKAKSILDWEPKITIEQGLKLLANWVKEKQ